MTKSPKSLTIQSFRGNQRFGKVGRRAENPHSTVVDEYVSEALELYEGMYRLRFCNISIRRRIIYIEILYEILPLAVFDLTFLIFCAIIPPVKLIRERLTMMFSKTDFWIGLAVGAVAGIFGYKFFKERDEQMGMLAAPEIPLAELQRQKEELEDLIAAQQAREQK